MHGNTKHGHAAGGKVSPEYISWRDMLARCHNPKHDQYDKYGAKGIQVCQIWRDSFTVFLDDMGLKPEPKFTIHRHNNDLGYSKDNCSWADKWTQANNKCNNNYVTYRGRKLALSQWARELNIGRKTLYRRLFHYRWSTHRAFTQAVRPY